MTLQQLKYVVTVAEAGTITNAAKKLYISQPSLTNAIHELEKEMNIVIFQRTNKGTGRIDVYLDNIEGTAAASVEFSSDDWQVVYNSLFSEVSGTHDVFFVFPAGFEFDSWQFA